MIIRRKLLLLTRQTRPSISKGILKMSTEGKMKYPDGNYVFYKQRKGIQSKPGIIFCSGYESNLNGNKAQYLDNYCNERSLSYMRFDYFGHAYSSGKLVEATLSQWKQNFIDVLDKLTTGPQIVVGSSIGGWVSILGAIERPDRIHSLVSIANATDLMSHRYNDKLESIKQVGCYTDPRYGITIGYEFIIDTVKNTLLDSKNKIPIHCPVRLLHGMADDVVPYQNSLKIAEKVASDDVLVQLVKNGDHRMSTMENLTMLSRTLDDLL
uniref:Peptidase S9 prolyl oligopeptidase catalytic domain-containing protein n=2 Tax=Clytia hemisphaerica TaxID=252671 RepID=A0A7M5WSR4_9CNID|eukprot:TCONS_00059616-protein